MAKNSGYLVKSKRLTVNKKFLMPNATRRFQRPRRTGGSRLCIRQDILIGSLVVFRRSRVVDLARIKLLFAAAWLSLAKLVIRESIKKLLGLLRNK